MLYGANVGRSRFVSTGAQAANLSVEKEMNQDPRKLGVYIQTALHNPPNIFGGFCLQFS